MVITQKQIKQLLQARTSLYHRICCAAIQQSYNQLTTGFKDDNELLSAIVYLDNICVHQFDIPEEKYRYAFMLLSLEYKVKEYPPDIVAFMTWPDRRSEKKIMLLKKYFDEKQSL